MRWPDHGEVPSIQSENRRYAEPFGNRDDRGVDCPERKVAVRHHQLSDAKPVAWHDWFGHQVSRRQIAEEPNLGLRPDPRGEQICDLRDNQDGNQDGTVVALKQTAAASVFGVVGVIGGIQRAGVRD